MRERNIVTAIILSIVTCGIYGVYWIYCIAEDIYNTENNLPTTPGLTLLLFIITGGLYGIYVFYQWGKVMHTIGDRFDVTIEDRSIVYIILSIVGLSLVNLVLIQTDINNIVDNM